MGAWATVMTGRIRKKPLWIFTENYVVIDLGALLMADARARGLYGYFSGRSFVIENDGDLSDARVREMKIFEFSKLRAHIALEKKRMRIPKTRKNSLLTNHDEAIHTVVPRKKSAFFSPRALCASGLHPFKSPALPFFGCRASNLLRLVFVTFGYLKL